MKEIRTKQELDEILSSENNKKIFIRVHADWCAPCQVLGRTILDIEGGYSNDYLFLEVNVDESDEDLVSRLSVFNLPTIVIFKGYEELFRRSGLLSRLQMTNLLDELKNK